MPILTLDSAKSLLQIGINDTSKDVVIEALLPIIQKDIISYCKNDFRDKNAPIYSTSGYLKYPKDSRYNYETLIPPYGFCFSSGISFSGSIISDSNNGFVNAGFNPGMDIAIEGSINDGVYQIKKNSALSAGSMVLALEDDSPLETESAGHYVLIARVKFPGELKLVAKQMLRFHLDKNAGSGKTSESIGDYSVGYGNTDYPQSILNALSRFRKFKS